MRLVRVPIAIGYAIAQGRHVSNCYMEQGTSLNPRQAPVPDLPASLRVDPVHTDRFAAETTADHGAVRQK